MPLPGFVCRHTLGLMVLCVGVAGVAGAQDYPAKPIRIVTSAAGGGSDFTARQIAQGISGSLAQPVVVDNRAGGIIAAEVVAKSPPDGYTLTVQGALWIVPLLAKAPYEVGDFAPVIQTERIVNIVAVHPSVPAKSVRELVLLAKARPGELNYASVSIGGSTHLAVELFKSMADANIVHVPYKGAATAVPALISGEVQLMIFDAGVLAPHVKSGKLRALAVTSAQPSALFPELPTVASSGLPGYESGAMAGLFAPVKTPRAIIDRLNQEIVRALSRPDVKERFQGQGLEVVAGTPDEFAAAIRADTARLSKVIKEAGIKVN
jgi:tripartite-type tricarboxylate transporter receptor subunit TctC